MSQFFHSYSDELQAWILKNVSMDFVGTVTFDTAEEAQKIAKLMNMKKLPSKYWV